MLLVKDEEDPENKLYALTVGDAEGESSEEGCRQNLSVG